MKKHYKNVLTKQSECSSKGELTFNLNEVTCIACLEEIRKEWDRQAKSFTGQPKKNAEKGLRKTIKRIELLEKETQNAKTKS